MKVIAFDPFLSPERALDLGVEKVELDELFKRADFITLHTPLTDKTRNIIDAAAHRKDEERRAHHQLRPRRARRRGGAARGARSRARSPAPPSTCSCTSRRRTTRCSAIRTSSARRISAPRPREAQENVALQVAEQMSDYLLRGAISQRGELPLDQRRGSAEAEALHRARRKARLVRRPVDRDPASSKVQIAYEGAVAQMNTKALTSAALAGLLRPMLGDVNIVSAPVVAKERGIMVEETTREMAGDYESLITVTVTTERQTRQVSGTVFADGRPRIVNIKGIRMDAEFGPSMIYITNLDKPGFIGRFSATLGEAGINIATFHVGRDAPGGNADRADRDRRRIAGRRARARCARCRRCKWRSR